MDRISRGSRISRGRRGGKVIHFGGLRIVSLLFCKINRSWWFNSQLSMREQGWRSVPPCMSIWSWLEYLIQAMEDVLPKVEEYLGVLLTNGEKIEWEIDRQIGAVSAVKWLMYRSVMVKRELSKGQALHNQWIYVPTFNYGHELSAVTVIIIPYTRDRN